MSDEHLRSKIEEALSTSNNDRHDAQKLLITWAVRDPQLLLGIAKPHLKAMAAALIDHELRSKGGKKSGDTGADKFSKQTIDAMIASGKTLPKADRRIPRNIPPPKSTERQASAMRKLAAAFTKKK